MGNKSLSKTPPEVVNEEGDLFDDPPPDRASEADAENKPEISEAEEEENLDDYRKRLKDLKNSGNLEEAAVLMNKVCRKFRHTFCSSDTYRRYAKVLVALNRVAEAVAAWDEFISDHQGDVYAWGQKVDFFKALGETDKALETLDACIAAMPSSGTSWNAKAEFLKELDRNEEALGVWNAMGAKKFDNQELTIFAYKKAEDLLFDDLERPDDAIAAWRELNARFPGEEKQPVEAALAECLQRAEKWEEALVAWDVVIANTLDEPTYPNTIARGYEGKGFLLEHLERWDEAIEVYRLTIDRIPDDEWGYAKIQVLCEKTERWDDLQAIWTEFCVRNPTSKAGYFRRMTGYESQDSENKVELIVAVWDEYVEADPEKKGRPALLSSKCGYLLYDLKDYEQALALINEIIEMEPDQMSHYQKRIDIFRAMEDKEAGLAALAAYAEKFPEDDFPSWNTAMFEEMGQEES